MKSKKQKGNVATKLTPATIAAGVSRFETVDALETDPMAVAAVLHQGVALHPLLPAAPQKMFART